ncbi:hypothetical protein POKO110462_11825 [Pontibacter korlensis]|uniref:Uncharacterized protein n=2 Tax=Pontibacter korlensis TaxID=400092 RepID=A0A0E3UV28_9BACT|nr:hypothetical protein [Pontibacter korlensis]AKD02147.1 hypothetical protein PKOR_02120 [Pontibacter korlensis]
MLGAVVVAGFTMLGANEAMGQSNPTPQNLPYEQTFEAMGEDGTTLPDGIAGWLVSYNNSKTNAESSVPSADAPVKSTSRTETSGGSIYHHCLSGNSQIYE